MRQSNRSGRTWFALIAITAFLSIPTTPVLADVFYVADQGQLVGISAAGVPTVLIKIPEKGFYDPTSIAIDDTGNLYLSNKDSVDIQKVTPNLGVSVFLSTHVQAWGVATDRLNNIYLAEPLGNTILKVTPGGVPTLLTDQVNRPASIAVDSAGNVFSSNWDNTVSKITPGGSVSTLASGINIPAGIALNGDGNVYVADLGDNSVLKIAPDGTITTFATGLDLPMDLTFGSNGDLYVLNRHTISEVTPSGVVMPFASGLIHPLGIVAQSVPEPSTMMIFAGVSMGLLSRHR